MLPSSYPQIFFQYMFIYFRFTLRKHWEITMMHHIMDAKCLAGIVVNSSPESEQYFDLLFFVRQNLLFDTFIKLDMKKLIKSANASRSQFH